MSSSQGRSPQKKNRKRKQTQSPGQHPFFIPFFLFISTFQRFISTFKVSTNVSSESPRGGPFPVRARPARRLVAPLWQSLEAFFVALFPVFPLCILPWFFSLSPSLFCALAVTTATLPGLGPPHVSVLFKEFIFSSLFILLAHLAVQELSRRCLAGRWLQCRLSTRRRFGFFNSSSFPFFRFSPGFITTFSPFHKLSSSKPPVFCRCFTRSRAPVSPFPALRPPFPFFPPCKLGRPLAIDQMSDAWHFVL